MRKQYIQMLQVGRNQGIEILKIELEKMGKEELKKAAKSNGYLGSFGRMKQEEIVKELCRWIESKTHYGECFRGCSEHNMFKKKECK